MQFDAFDSNRLHESEIRGQPEVFSLSLSSTPGSRLSLFREEKFLGKKFLGPGLGLANRVWQQ